MTDASKKTPTAPEGAVDTAELARLREENALLKRGNPNWTADEHIRHLASLPLWDPAHARPLQPQKWIALQSLACGTVAIMLAALKTNSRDYRFIKADLPPWIDATMGPAMKLHPDARRVVDKATMGACGIYDAWLRDAVLRMDAGNYEHTPLSAAPYSQVAATHHEIFGKGKKGHQARIERLERPTYQLQGLTLEQARPLLSYFRELVEGEPLPQEWLDLTKETGVDRIVYETPRLEPAPPLPPEMRDQYQPATPPASHVGPGRY